MEMAKLLSVGLMETVQNYNSYDMSLTIPISLLCDDGTTARDRLRERLWTSGSGTMRDSKGRDWQFVFGDNAAALFRVSFILVS